MSLWIYDFFIGAATLLSYFLLETKLCLESLLSLNILEFFCFDLLEGLSETWLELCGFWLRWLFGPKKLLPDFSLDLLLDMNWFERCELFS